MESRYIPPHMRNKKKVVPEKAREPSPPPSFTENDFPALSNTEKTSVFDKKNGKSFANMATEWAAHREEQVRIEEIKKQESEQLELLRRQYRVAPLPHFHNVRHFVEPEDDENEDEEKTYAPSNPEEEGWMEVKAKKRRKAKTFEERMNRPSTPEEGEGETVWNGDEDEDSYWKN